MINHDYEKMSWHVDHIQRHIEHTLSAVEACITQGLTEYAEHQSRWKAIADGTPESDTWVVIIPKENFCGNDLPVLARYDKESNMFSENGEEFPHSAIVKFRTFSVEGGL